jgi:hypothetical protein
MSPTSCASSRIDPPTIIQKICGLFDQSPAFREARVSPPRLTADGEVIVEVSFAGGPVRFRIVAPSTDTAYAVLHELASAIIEAERNRAGTPGPPPRNGDEEGSLIIPGHDGR